MKKIFLIVAVLLLSLGLVSAISQKEIIEAKSLIDSKVSCNKLTDEQLELIGEYYMEQMHPGESHELMHQMMGLKEGSEAEEQFHINMAKAIYCGEANAFRAGGMMGGGMMNMMRGIQNPTQTNMMQGMMGNFGYGFGYWSSLNFLYALLLIELIILVFLGIVKLWKDLFHGRGR